MTIDLAWFKALPYLLYLMKQEKEYKQVSTSVLAEEFGFSQQTASRLLRELESEGLIRRDVTPKGQFVELTKKGKDVLLAISSELDSVLKEPIRKISLRGRLISGSGEGAYYMTRAPYVRQFEHLLGYTPFPGTLNLELPPEDVVKKAKLASLEHTFISGFKARGRAFGPIRCYPCIINNKVRGHILIPERTHHPENIIEVICEKSLRKMFKLKDGDELRIDVIES